MPQNQDPALAPAPGSIAPDLLREATMKWTDTRELAIALAETHPAVDPRTILFTDLKRWVLELPGFDDDPKHSGEKILEAIQMAWMDEGDFDED